MSISSTPNSPATNDIQARPQTGRLMPIEPESYNEVILFADLAVKAGYFQLRNVQDAALRILYGREMGLSTMQSLMGVQVVEGNPGLKAHVIGARVQQSGVWNFNVVKWDDTICEIEFTKHGKYHNKSAFTIEDGLKSKGVPKDGWFKPLSNWDKFTKAMLFARALTQGVRAFCPEIFMGPVYSSEELSDGIEAIDVSIVEQKPSPPAEERQTAKQGATKPVSENEKSRRIDDWASRAAKRMEGLGHEEFKSPGQVIAAVHRDLADEGHIKGFADTYRSRIAEIAGLSDWEETQKTLNATMKRIQESLNQGGPAGCDAEADAQPEPKPAAKTTQKRQPATQAQQQPAAKPAPQPAAEEAPFYDQPSNDTRVRQRPEPAAEAKPSPLAVTVASIESWLTTVAQQNDEGGMAELADREVLLDWLWDRFVAAGQVKAETKHLYSRLNELAKLGGDTNGALRLLDAALESVRKDYMGTPDVDEAKPEQPAEAAAAGEPVGARVTALDKLSEEWADAFADAGVKAYSVPATVIDQVYFRAMKTGLVSANARDYRSKTKDLATIAETFDGIHKKIHPILEAMWADFVKDEPGSDG